MNLVFLIICIVLIKIRQLQLQLFAICSYNNIILIQWLYFNNLWVERRTTVHNFPLETMILLFRLSNNDKISNKQNKNTKIISLSVRN